MTEREQVTAVVADWKTGVIGLGDAVERITAILGLDGTDSLQETEDILQDGEDSPIDLIVNSLDSAFELDPFDRIDDDDDFEDDEFDDFDEPEDGPEPEAERNADRAPRMR